MSLARHFGARDIPVFDLDTVYSQFSSYRGIFVVATVPSCGLLVYCISPSYMTFLGGVSFSYYENHTFV